ncbi:dihydroorotase [Helicobacter cholecystus]|uniref:Dihydroorotase n=1 Tax=Helicobacter cholecystus TaxID=45498 RepID=A0A3D8IWZ7_9HELI|nr:dihydroorotase [Helicobacter cholecystus]RDU69486.1 dihydroorotase [Helicobacter cholecystus]VEJ24037.1 dihydroorotase [Helicobacter cholecystus]
MQFTLKNPLDMHLHLRDGLILENVLKYSANPFIGGVVMPNLSTPITTVDLASSYRLQIASLYDHFEVISTLYITPSLNKQTLENAKNLGIKILKLYPKGATTNSQNGLDSILEENTLEIFSLAQDMGFILSIHAESAGFSMDREFEFLQIIQEIAINYPKLQIIIEHLSDRRSIDMIEKFSNVYATLTLHHITLTLDDLLGKGLNPHLFCKPILKTPKDRDALLSLALCAHPKVSFGSDSAPHLLSKKLTSNASAGIFSSPCLLEQLVELFETHHALDKLQAFVSDNAIKNYGLTPKINKTIIFTKQEQSIPAYIPVGEDRIVPLNACQTLQWSIQAIHSFKEN